MIFRRRSGVIEETPDEARQGRKGAPILLVLVASTVLAVIALWIAFVAWGAMSSVDEAAEVQDAPPTERIAPAP